MPDAALSLKSDQTLNMGSQEDLQQQEWMVDWTKGDSKNPRNFTKLLKIWIKFNLFMAGSIASSFGASIISPAADISSAFRVSREVAQLTVRTWLRTSVQELSFGNLCITQANITRYLYFCLVVNLVPGFR